MGIIGQAIDDWRMLIDKGITGKNGGLGRDINYIEIRRFFKSAWCDMLLDPTGIEGKEILEMLERELQEAIEKEAEEKEKCQDTQDT